MKLRWIWCIPSNSAIYDHKWWVLTKARRYYELKKYLCRGLQKYTLFFKVLRGMQKILRNFVPMEYWEGEQNDQAEQDTNPSSDLDGCLDSLYKVPEIHPFAISRRRWLRYRIHCRFRALGESQIDQSRSKFGLDFASGVDPWASAEWPGIYAFWNWCFLSCRRKGNLDLRHRGIGRQFDPAVVFVTQHCKHFLIHLFIQLGPLIFKHCG